MNVTDFTYLIKNPSKVTDPLQTRQLEDILKEYPYFQAARALHLKGLKNLNSYKYNKALKTTAAYTADRDVLFHFITSKDFLRSKPVAPTVSVAAKKTAKQQQEPPKQDIITDSEDAPLPRDKKDAEQLLDPGLFTSKTPSQKAMDTLQLGQPLEFNKKEKFSFTQWLELTSKQPLPTNRKKEEALSENTVPPENSAVKQDKFDRIERFINTNPKIVPKENTPIPDNVSNSGILDQNELMTETLARVYLEQKKYKNAIQAYRILSLKYPEKSGFFADRIKMIEKIQLENR